MKRARTFLASLLLSVAPLASQQSPNKEHGFAPEKAYHLGEIDSVNAFNGNLVVTLPIGPSLPVAADLGFGLTLVYNSSLWEQRMPGSPGAPYTDPNPIFNAGLGWRLSMGELLPPSHPSNHTSFWVYVGPDGAHHPFGDEGGVFQSLTGLGTPAPTQGTVVAYTQDGSYLRLTHTPGASQPLLLELPGGTRHRFDAEGKLVKIENRSGVGVAISYGTHTWTATDAHGRQVQVVFQNRAGVMIRKVVHQILVPSFEGTQVGYDFAYEDRELPRGCPNDDGYGAVRVPLLKRIDRPDGSRFDLPVATSYVTKTGDLCSNESGLLVALRLPSLGRLEWDYENFLFPSADLPDRCRDFFSNGPGVVTRRLVDADGSPVRTWTYDRVLDFPTCIRPPGPTDPSRWVRTTVTDPLGHQTEQHFSVSIVDDGGWKVNEYGLPITHAEPGSNGRLLSKRIKNASGTLLRSEYLSYAIDTASLDLPGAKHQVTGSRTVFHDDGGKHVDRAFSDFDGLGHFRTMTHTDDFGLGGSPHVETTAWNPTRGSQGSWAPPGPSEPWVLEVYTQKQASEAGSNVLAESSFDAHGRLACERRRLSATARTVHDVVVTYAYDAAGNPTQEKWHGGDLAEVGTTQTCSLDDPPSTTIHHTWSAGVLATTQHAGANFKSVDRTIHTGTGLVSASRDVSGLATTYDYDEMGRVTQATPPDGEVPIHFTYHDPTPPATLAKIRVYRGDPNAPFSDGELWVDDFGRVYEERRLMPSGWARKRTFFNENGLKSDESEWGAVAGGEAGLVFTGYRNYDPFGRPELIHPPDSTPANRAHDVTLSYAGTRVVSRTVAVGTGRNPTTNEPIETAATTTERYDGQGRLAQVVEPAGAGGANTTTTYGYDCAGRLRTVTQVDGGDTQTRTLTYDGRGFMTSEQHPEKGATGNGTVTYSDFDARGKAHRKVDGSATLTFDYDGAERLTEVHEVTGPTTTRPLKVLTYGATNVGSNKVLGKLETATRYNHVDLATLIGQEDWHEYRVLETYSYAGKGGRISAHWSDLFIDDVAQTRFVANQTWNDLGEVAESFHPRCVGCDTRPGMTTTREVVPTYTYGLLTGLETIAFAYSESSPSVDGWTFSHHPTGQLARIDHPSGLTETWTLDPTGPPRPGRIEVEDGAGATLWTSGDYRYDGAGNVTEMGGSWFRYDGVSRLVEARVTTDPWSSGGLLAQTYSYDGFGNIQGIAGASGHSTPTSKVSNRLTSAGYDNRGNLTDWLSTTYRYDALGSMWRTTAGAEDWVYVYDADGERVLEIKLGGDLYHRWTLRGAGSEVQRIYTETGPSHFWQVEKDYLYSGDKPLWSAGNGFSRTLHTDHLGTPRLLTDSLGGVAAFHTYYPYGEEATSPFQDQERMKFTGHERDLGDPNSTADDLDYMHARFCSPVWGRFLSVDPGPSFLEDPQSWNRYAYAAGNPILFTDPTGEVISLSHLGESDRNELLTSLSDFTGNTYGADDKGNLYVVAYGPGASPTATAFLDEVIASETTYTVRERNESATLFGERPSGTSEITMDFRDFDEVDYGRVDPRAFSPASVFLHELSHAARGTADPIGQKKLSEIGDTVAFINQMRVERGMPTRAPIYSAVSVGFLGTKRGINFQGVDPKNPERVYYVRFPLILSRAKKK